MIQLRSGAARAKIDNYLGAGIDGLEFASHSILSVGNGRVSGSPFAQGMNLLAPFSNRISGPFTFNGQTHAVSANLSGEPFAIHGDAFQKSWSVSAQSSDQATLTLKGDIAQHQPACLIYSLNVSASVIMVLLPTVSRTVRISFQFR